MKFANAVNRLITKFILLDFDETLQAEMPIIKSI